MFDDDMIYPFQGSAASDTISVCKTGSNPFLSDPSDSGGPGSIQNASRFSSPKYLYFEWIVKHKKWMPINNNKEVPPDTPDGMFDGQIIEIRE